MILLFLLPQVVLASAGPSDTAVLDKPSEQVRVLRGDAFSVISTSQVETLLMKMNDMGMNILYQSFLFVIY